MANDVDVRGSCCEVCFNGLGSTCLRGFNCPCHGTTVQEPPPSSLAAQIMAIRSARPLRVEVGESERQLILLALAQLSIVNPGLDFALNQVALLFDEPVSGLSPLVHREERRGSLYDEFRRLRGVAMPAKPLQEDPLYREANQRMNALWTWAVDRPGYDKKKWQELEAAINAVARHGKP